MYIIHFCFQQIILKKWNLYSQGYLQHQLELDNHLFTILSVVPPLPLAVIHWTGIHPKKMRIIRSLKLQKAIHPQFLT